MATGVVTGRVLTGEASERAGTVARAHADCSAGGVRFCPALYNCEDEWQAAPMKPYRRKFWRLGLCSEPRVLGSLDGRRTHGVCGRPPLLRDRKTPAMGR